MCCCLVAPQIISTRTEWRVLKHSDVTVPCYYREGFPTDTEVRWVFGSNPSGGTIVSRNQNLTFKAQEFDSGKEGEYTCIVENAVGQDFLTIKLLVDCEYLPYLSYHTCRSGSPLRGFDLLISRLCFYFTTVFCRPTLKFFETRFWGYCILVLLMRGGGGQKT